jgi:hypothetical protein
MAVPPSHLKERTIIKDFLCPGPVAPCVIMCTHILTNTMPCDCVGSEILELLGTFISPFVELFTDLTLTITFQIGFMVSDIENLQYVFLFHLVQAAECIIVNHNFLCVQFFSRMHFLSLKVSLLSENLPPAIPGCIRVCGKYWSYRQNLLSWQYCCIVCFSLFCSGFLSCWTNKVQPHIHLKSSADICSLFQSSLFIFSHFQSSASEVCCAFTYLLLAFSQFLPVCGLYKDPIFIDQANHHIYCICILLPL